MSKHTYTTGLQWGGDIPTAELEDVSVTYTVMWGRPAWGGSRWEPPINPPDPDEIDDIQITSIDGKPFDGDPALADAIKDKLLDGHYDAMLENAAEECVG